MLLLILSLFLSSFVILPLLLILIIIRLIVYNDNPACDKLSLIYICILVFFYQRRKLRYFSVNFASSFRPFPSFNPFPPLFPLTFPSFLLDSFLNKNLIMSRW